MNKVTLLVACQHHAVFTLTHFRVCWSCQQQKFSICHCKMFVPSRQGLKTSLSPSSDYLNRKIQQRQPELISWFCRLCSSRVLNSTIISHLTGSPHHIYITLQTNTYLWSEPYSESILQLTTFICVKLCASGMWTCNMDASGQTSAKGGWQASSDRPTVQTDSQALFGNYVFVAAPNWTGE